MATFQRTCEQCGKDFATSSRRARFCGATCRSRSHRGKSPVAAVPDQQPADARPAAAVPERPTYDTLEEQVRASLTELNALETIAGMGAIRIAQQIDRGGDSGSAVVSLSKELSRLRHEAIVEAAPKNRDAADDVLDRVNAKLRLVVS